MRQPWDDYFLSIAAQVATRSTCPRKAVGCVLTVDRRIIASGYNGALPGHPHCSEAGCLLTDTYHFTVSEPRALFGLCAHDILEADCHTCAPRGKPIRHCVRTVHAETNALLQAARHGPAVNGGTAYVTASPCVQCMMNLISAGIRAVVYTEEYRLDLTLPIAEQAGIALRKALP